jgi:hypothetical protein
MKKKKMPAVPGLNLSNNTIGNSFSGNNATVAN